MQEIMEPLHRNKKLNWDLKENLVGEKVQDPWVYSCHVCDLPILIYGRLASCKHAFCLDCAEKSENFCPKCNKFSNDVEEVIFGELLMCTFDTEKHSKDVCGKTYRSTRDLQSHIDLRHKDSSNIHEPPSVTSHYITQIHSGSDVDGNQELSLSTVQSRLNDSVEPVNTKVFYQTSNVTSSVIQASDSQLFDSSVLTQLLGSHQILIPDQLRDFFGQKVSDGYQPVTQKEIASHIVQATPTGSTVVFPSSQQTLLHEHQSVINPVQRMSSDISSQALLQSHQPTPIQSDHAQTAFDNQPQILLQSGSQQIHTQPMTMVRQGLPVTLAQPSFHRTPQQFAIQREAPSPSHDVNTLSIKTGGTALGHGAPYMRPHGVRADLQRHHLDSYVSSSGHSGHPTSDQGKHTNVNLDFSNMPFSLNNYPEKNRPLSHHVPLPHPAGNILDHQYRQPSAGFDPRQVTSYGSSSPSVIPSTSQTNLITVEIQDQHQHPQTLDHHQRHPIQQQYHTATLSGPQSVPMFGHQRPVLSGPFSQHRSDSPARAQFHRTAPPSDHIPRGPRLIEHQMLPQQQAPHRHIARPYQYHNVQGENHSHVPPMRMPNLVRPPFLHEARGRHPYRSNMPLPRFY